MATIKPIEGRTVHQIQSGQVIVDLCSVVKELVENSIDAGAASIDVRFKNQGLDCIEVQDNGSGVSPENYETIALKHHTSKLSTYSDLATLQTFGFRGEALSSLCALSQLSVVTCIANDVPKGTKLEFEISGKLKGACVVAAQKGTNIIVENLFHNLPVRRRELERNIKREWNKVIALLNQYACIQIGVRFTVSQQPSKGKRIVLFSTKGNLTTRDNLVNIFGTKTMTGLVKLDMKLEFEPTTTSSGFKSGQRDKLVSTEICIHGYASRPAHGEGRQTPDRQMFFVNGRPCGLPQFAKVFNEVYRAYNTSQSPFIFADIQLDTHLYDVNVSPDKRTILLHDQNRLLENLREALITIFQSQDYSIPVAQPSMQKPQLGAQASISEDNFSKSGRKNHMQAAFVTKKTIHNTDGGSSNSEAENDEGQSADKPLRRTRAMKPRKPTPAETQSHGFISRWVGRRNEDRVALGNNQKLEHLDPSRGSTFPNSLLTGPDLFASKGERGTQGKDECEDEQEEKAEAGEEEGWTGWLGSGEASTSTTNEPKPQPAAATGMAGKIIDFHHQLAEPDGKDIAQTPLEQGLKMKDTGRDAEQADIPAITPIRTSRDTTNMPAATSRSHMRAAPEIASVTIGDHAISSPINLPPKGARAGSGSGRVDTPLESKSSPTAVTSAFGSSLNRLFSATKQSEQPAIAKARVGELDKAGFNTHTEARGHNTDKCSSPEDDPEPETMDISAVDEGRSVSSQEVAEPLSPMDEPTKRLLGCRNETVSRLEAAATDRASDTPSELVNVTGHRSHALGAGIKRKDATLQHRHNMKMTERHLQSSVDSWIMELERMTPPRSRSKSASGIESSSAEEILSLIISKSDFRRMAVIGQFNLGFIIAVRHAPRDCDSDAPIGDDEVFIIDQHASDEKYNFERLQLSTSVQSQRLVHPKQLELTALEEEIVMENIAALDVNGFKIGVDDSGEQPVGSRCKLLALPLSRETTFTLSDLEELITLLGEHRYTEASSAPRPSKVRALFAMRACRSSVMIGKALTHRQMQKLVRHMGELDKPWNCPHGRPTMRHLSGLGSWDDKGWKEAEPRVNWAEYAQG